jgi:hypothetical protein
MVALLRTAIPGMVEQPLDIAKRFLEGREPFVELTPEPFGALNGGVSLPAKIVGNLGDRQRSSCV